MHRHHLVLHFLRNRELNELYVSIAIRRFAVSMILIFIPIYLLNLGYSLSQIFFFFIVISISHAIFTIPAGKISSKFGLKHAMLFSIPLLIVFYALLYTLDTYNWPLTLLAVIFGIKHALFWVAYHVDFAKFSKKKHRGKEVSFVRILTSLVTVIGPLVGGLILAVFGFHILLVIVSLLLFASAIPLFISSDIHERAISFSIKRIFTEHKLRDAVSFIGHGIDFSVGNVVWPIFLFFFVLDSFVGIGLATTLALLFSLLSALVVRKFSEIKRKQMLRIGSLINSLVWFIKTFVRTGLEVFLLESLHGISRSMNYVPFEAIGYDKANRGNIVEYAMFREIMVHIGHIILFTIMIFVADLALGLLMGGGGSLFYLFF